MSVRITNECINCDVCVSKCPTNSIYFGKTIYEVNKSTCNECKDQISGPKCKEICPIDCIVYDDK